MSTSSDAGPPARDPDRLTDHDKTTIRRAHQIAGMPRPAAVRAYVGTAVSYADTARAYAKALDQATWVIGELLAIIERTAHNGAGVTMDSEPDEPLARCQPEPGGQAEVIRASSAIALGGIALIRPRTYETIFAGPAGIFTLQNLDGWPQAELMLRHAREASQHSGNPDRATWVTAAVPRYWLGEWDDALAELDPDDTDAPGLTHSYLRERWLALLLHGVAALIAGRRDERTVADQQLRQGLALPIRTLADRENQDFLVAAHALALEQSGETHQAMLRLAAMLPRRDGEMTLIHQWLPDLVRLALAAGDWQMARTATRACQAEAAAELHPAWATVASLRCLGLEESDPEPLEEAVAHYRALGPAVELPATLEDLAVVLAKGGREEDARAALVEAFSLYEGLQARWDIRRAEGRLRPHGIRHRARDQRSQRAAFGWAALTPTEVKIAAMLARGDSTSDIASGMFLSRRTVQTYISHILAKLGVKGRVDIVREALRQGVSP